MAGSGEALSPAGRAAALFTVGLVTLLSAVASGRVGANDVGDQVRNVVWFVHTGELGIPASELPERTADDDENVVGLWIHGPGDQWYQVHDVGNKLLMLPSVVASTVLGAQDSESDASGPTKVAVATTATLFSVLLPLAIWRVLRRAMGPRAAMAWGLLSLVGTMLLPYAKSTWDVMPAAVLVSIALLASVRYWEQPTSWRAAQLGAAGGAVLLFRFSLVPLVVVSVVLAVVHGTPGQRPSWRRSWRDLIVVGVAGIVAAGPALLMNTHLTGRPWLPATGTEHFDTQLVLSGDPIAGTFGLLASPNRGLILFCPMLLGLALYTRTRERLSSTTRRLLAVWGPGTCTYVLLIASVEVWSPFGWGPRYLVPIVPVLFVIAAPVLQVLRRQSTSWHRTVTAVVTVGTVVAVAPTLTNWHAVSATRYAVVSPSTWQPLQLIETFRYTRPGRIPASTDGEDDFGVDSRVWPDLAILYVTRSAGVPDVTGYAGFIVVAGTALLLLRRAILLADGAATPTSSTVT